MSTPETTAATRRMFRSITIGMGLLIATLLIGGSALGWFLGGIEGLWGVLMGTGIAALFMLTTAAIGWWTADKPIYIASGSLMAGWIFKVLILFVALALFREKDFYNPVALAVVVIVAIIGSTAIEMRAAARARVPYVDH